MKVTKAQAQENRAHIVQTAAALFRERGYDGVGIAELMSAAGFTQGGFYKHFRSKADLMAETAASGIAQRLANDKHADLSAFVDSYLSRDHRDDRGAGCTMAALSGDAARQGEDIRATFAQGIENSLANFVDSEASPQDAGQARETMLDTYARVVGAVMLSRACPDDSALAEEILQVSRARILAALGAQQDG
ncbi:TetR family transcriptional regulator [Xanthomonas arboricola]|uniref:TetR family transcriptional regulator n=1 Tax=Xanthomonas arboricola TaxID=56448 RepID=UPI000E1F1408|nr:TetR family transcriptional regulator [Xanthomonas arboricola]